MRGKDIEARRKLLRRGITPAYAGKRIIIVSSISSNRDHPRVCGEKEGRRPCVVGVPGITPAYAGKRHSVFGYGRNTRDHPRVCGEKCEPKHDLFNEQGSPPRMRGKELLMPVGCTSVRITPAYAGKRNSKATC